jgi:beta-1,4-mannosyl-glycoprotein beta-1,4-N-acetylglucosaminyltransferase
MYNRVLFHRKISLFLKKRENHKNRGFDFLYFSCYSPNKIRSRRLKKICIFSLSGLILALLFFFWPARSEQKPKVYDCFLFFNELELLEIRLNEMAPYVDYFVLVEASETFRGKDKPLHFAENASRFEKFKDKILHVVVQECLETTNPWEREHYQREQVMRALKICHKNDVILLSDLDEIVKGECIPEIVEQLHKVQAVVCEQKMYYGYLNCYQGPWSGTFCTTYDTLQEITVLQARKLRNRKPREMRKNHLSKIALLKEAGWHFTSMGGVDRWALKLASYSHNIKNVERWKSGQQFRDTLAATTPVAIDASFPKYVVEHQELLRQKGFIL